jgi:hypothetical protein
MENRIEHFPTAAEMRALELAAHRARSRELLRLIRAGVAGAKALFERLAAAVHIGERIGHA